MEYTQNRSTAQAQTNGFISVEAPPSDNFIETLAQSPRGDMRGRRNRNRRLRRRR
jgi:hypothetical protein